jgi:hypothetical protein
MMSVGILSRDTGSSSKAPVLSPTALPSFGPMDE